MFQLSYKTLQLKLNKIQGKSRSPVDFGKVSHDKAHSEFPLADIVKATTRITTILPEQSIKSAVKGLM
jgi:hypothetical protein